MYVQGAIVLVWECVIGSSRVKAAAVHSIDSSLEACLQVTTAGEEMQCSDF